MGFLSKRIGIRVESVSSKYVTLLQPGQNILWRDSFKVFWSRNGAWKICCCRFALPSKPQFFVSRVVVLQNTSRNFNKTRAARSFVLLGLIVSLYFSVPVALAVLVCFKSLMTTATATRTSQICIFITKNNKFYMLYRPARRFSLCEVKLPNLKSCAWRQHMTLSFYFSLGITNPFMSF